MIRWLAPLVSLLQRMLWYRFNAWPVIGAMGELSETICPVPAKITTLIWDADFTFGLKQLLSRILASALLAALALTGAALGQEAKDQPSKPKLSIQKLEHNFGEIKKGAPA